MKCSEGTACPAGRTGKANDTPGARIRKLFVIPVLSRPAAPANDNQRRTNRPIRVLVWTLPFLCLGAIAAAAALLRAGVE